MKNTTKTNKFAQLTLILSSWSCSLFDGIKKSQNSSSVNFGLRTTSKFFFTWRLAFWPTNVPENWNRIIHQIITENKNEFNLFHHYCSSPMKNLLMIDLEGMDLTNYRCLAPWFAHLNTSEGRGQLINVPDISGDEAITLICNSVAKRSKN